MIRLSEAVYSSAEFWAQKTGGKMTTKQKLATLPENNTVKLKSIKFGVKTQEWIPLKKNRNSFKPMSMEYSRSLYFGPKLGPCGDQSNDFINKG